MKKLNILKFYRENTHRRSSVFTLQGLLLLAFITGLLMTSCQKGEETYIKMAGPLTISTSSSDIVLSQKNDKNKGLTLSWNTGTNHGTGSSISYQLQIDKKGNNFSSAVKFDMGKGVNNRTFTVAELNDSLLSHWKFQPGIVSQLEARVISTVYSDPQVQDISDSVKINVTPYQPVSKTLYLLGDASPNGSNASKAIALTPKETDSTIFVYQGSLNAGNLKFITKLGQLLPSYNKGADSYHVTYRTSDSQADNQFTINEAGVYKVIVSLLDSTISITKMDLPPYSTIYIVGDAAPNGWDISNASPLVQDKDNPFIFTYTGVLKAGSFKFPVNRNTDWGQDMYMRSNDSLMYLHKGGASDDNKWTISKKGYYTLTLNLLDNSIKIQRTELYMVGSATPIGWSIDQAIAMTEDATDGCIFTYSGPMVAGDFKFPVNRNSDWGQDMYMKVDDTHMYRHVGGASDDNKWTLTAAGNYLITANIETLTISIQKQ